MIQQLLRDAYGLLRLGWRIVFQHGRFRRQVDSIVACPECAPAFICERHKTMIAENDDPGESVAVTRDDTVGIDPGRDDETCCDDPELIQFPFGLECRNCGAAIVGSVPDWD